MPVTATVVPAVQYIRMSMDNQNYSIESQIQTNAEYAAQRGYQIIDSYIDAGKSGLSLRGRDALKKLLSDALNPGRQFQAILVRDVSRWGRFQNPDQAAHYEFLCRDAGVAVHYCAEPFENDLSPMASILKNLKRVMAHEYSREISEKVTRAKLQQARLGHKMGGSTVYGFHRMLQDQHGNPRFLLGPGQRKAIRSDRVRFVLGTPAEQEVIRSIFELYVHGAYSFKQIAASFREAGILATGNRPWTAAMVSRVMASELCVGRYAYNKVSAKLQGPQRKNPERLWVRVPDILPPLISEELFAKAQVCRALRQSTKIPQEKLLSDLRQLLLEKGRLSIGIINNAPGIASATAYKDNFGTMAEVYRQIGYKKPYCISGSQRAWTRDQLRQSLSALYQRHGFLSYKLIDDDISVPSTNWLRRKLGGRAAIYAFVGAAPKTHSDIMKEAWRRHVQQVKPLPRVMREIRFERAAIVKRLQELLSLHGYLSVPLVKADPHLPSTATIEKRFGSYVNAYRAAGWDVDRSKLATLRNNRCYRATTKARRKLPAGRS
ncbi:MAG TPA: recombinase family protein [Rhizomicrobium sp.]|jgi:DNA invertase Pin-like site-specific DNA recombinase